MDAVFGKLGVIATSTADALISSQIQAECFPGSNPACISAQDTLLIVHRVYAGNSVDARIYLFDSELHCFVDELNRLQHRSASLEGAYFSKAGSQPVRTQRIRCLPGP